MVAFWIAVAIQIIGFIITMRELEKHSWFRYFDKYDIVTTILAVIISATLYIFMVAHFGLVLPLLLMMIASGLSYVFFFVGVIRNGGIYRSLSGTLLNSAFAAAMFIWLYNF